MSLIYRLEFNEEQQCFHMDDYTHGENTFGWFTIFDHCTELEACVYQAYVRRIPRKRLTKEYLLKCVAEVRSFTNQLLEYGISLSINGVTGRATMERISG